MPSRVHRSVVATIRSLQFELLSVLFSRQARRRRGRPFATLTAVAHRARLTPHAVGVLQRVLHPMRGTRTTRPRTLSKGRARRRALAALASLASAAEDEGPPPMPITLPSHSSQQSPHTQGHPMHAPTTETVQTPIAEPTASSTRLTTPAPVTPQGHTMPAQTHEITEAPIAQPTSTPDNDNAESRTPSSDVVATTPTTPPTLEELILAAREGGKDARLLLKPAVRNVALSCVLYLDEVDCVTAAVLRYLAKPGALARARPGGAVAMLEHIVREHANLHFFERWADEDEGENPTDPDG